MVAEVAVLTQLVGRVPWRLISVRPGARVGVRGGTWHRQAVVEALQDVHLALNEADLLGRVQLNKLVNVDVAAAYADIYLIALLNLDLHFPRPEAVYALGFSHEHNLNIVSIRELIDKLSQRLINMVILARNVDAVALLELRFLLDESEYLLVVSKESLVYVTL